ncbi:hypothetical protein FHT76_008304 [Rhizobium sp. BK176]|nr:hypothetical protein [Rhizobium sp. BK181]MBB3544559.1 hypothetical protein [Rhizobium sp. BK399]MCS3744104.1 hypothetical protein [Rhizobium sp. BK661]MCS4096582.1 hypothetical protein [Rhizobium sp. BK176]
MAEVEPKLELVTSDRDKLLACDLLGKPDETITQNAV